MICFATIRLRKKAHPGGIVNLCGYKMRRLPRAINRYYSFRLMHDLHYLHWPRRRRNLKDPKKEGNEGKTTGYTVGTYCLKKKLSWTAAFSFSLSLFLFFFFFFRLSFFVRRMNNRRERERERHRQTDREKKKKYETGIFRIFGVSLISLRRDRFFFSRGRK